MKVSMARVMRLDGLMQQLDGQLDHIRGVTPDSHDQPPLPAALAAREHGVVEQRLAGWGAAEDDVRGADLLAQQARVLAVARGEQAEGGVGPALALLGGEGDAVEALEQVAGAGEPAVDDVDVADGGAPQHEGEADVPVGLLAGAEGREGVHAVAAGDEAGRGQGGAEGRKGGGVQDADGLAGGGEECDGAGGFDLGFAAGGGFLGS